MNTVSAMAAATELAIPTLTASRIATDATGGAGFYATISCAWSLRARSGEAILVSVLSMSKRVDGVALLIAVAAVACGSLVGARSTARDVDELLFSSTIVHMQHGDSYYDAFEKALREKDGEAPTQVRSVRTPVVSEILAPFPAATWRWLAAIPALALCLAAAALAGDDLLARRLTTALTGLWMLVSLPLLFLHAELWGAPLLVGAGLAVRKRHDGRAAVLCLLATGIRETFGLSLLVGLLLRRNRRPWAGAVVAAGAGGALHVLWAQRILDPAGYDPPLRAVDRYISYLAPGKGGAAQMVGVALLAIAVVGFVLRRNDPAFRFLAFVVGPLVVAGAMSGRSYWTLTWCGATSAAGGVALAVLADRVGWRHTVPILGIDGATSSGRNDP